MRIEYHDQTDSHYSRTVWVFLAAVLMLTVPAEATSPKGLYGQIRPITNHPNLYYNLGEIQELRELILNGTGPQRLINAYHSAASGRMGMVGPDPWHDSRMSDRRVVHHNNMEACVEYMLKPTQVKADKMREAILSFVRALPNGMNGGVADGDNGMSVPWMYDLVMGFHPDTFSSSDRNTMLAWFDKNAKFSQNKGRDHSDASFSEENIRTYEGRRLLWYPNWYAMQMVSGLNFALLTGNQADLDFWADSGYPHELFDDTGITSTYPPQTANRIDLIKFIKAIFDSGANFDTYARDGWNGTSFSSPYNFSDFGYHVYQANPVMLAAEAAYHNGMTGVFDIKPASGGKPLIQRYHEFTVNARGALNRRRGNEYLVPYSPIVYYGLRRYGSSTIEDGAPTSNLDIGYSNGMERHPELAVIFGYPHRVPVSSGSAADNPPPPEPAPNNPPRPGSVAVQGAAGSDDAEENSDGRVYSTSSDLELIEDRWRGDQFVGMRFNGLLIPQGAVIVDAYVQFQVDETSSGSTSLLLEGEATNHAFTFDSSNGDISSRSRTTAAVAWSPDPWTTKGEIGPAQRTPNLSAIIQEIVDRPGWTNGNSVALIVTGTGKRVATSFDLDPTGAPRLHVEYLAN